jgi:AcrR family transcriptional regulator
MSTSRQTTPSQPARADAVLRPSRRPGPAGGKRDTNRKERTQALLTAGLRLFLARGVENVTVDEIAKEAGTAKGNFYRYATDKQDLVEALVQPVDEAFDAAFKRCNEDSETATSQTALTTVYMRLAFDLLEVLRSHPETVRLYLQEAHAPAIGARIPIANFQQKLIAHAVRMTQVAHDKGLLKKIPPLVSALAVMGAVERLLMAHLRDGLFDNPADAVRHLVRFVMEGIS